MVLIQEPEPQVVLITASETGAGGGSGTVTTFGFTNANGVSGVVTNPTTTPNLTISLGAITPTSVAATGNVTGLNLSGTNTGDVALGGENYLSLAGQAITANPINLSGSNVTGDLPFAKLPDVGASKLLGRTSAGAGEVQEITLGTNLSMSGQTLNASLAGAVVRVGSVNENQVALWTGLDADAIKGCNILIDPVLNSISGLSDISYTGDLRSRDPDGSHYLIIHQAGNLTNTRTLTYNVLDNSRTLTLGGDINLQANLTVSSAATISGTNTGDQTITLTGDVTGSGTGSFAATIANNAVTFAKMADINTDKLIGRDTAAAGDPEEIGVTGGIEFTGTGSIQTSAFTGDVTKAAGGTALAIANNAVTTAKILDDNVTLAKIADIADQTILGNNTGGASSPIALTAAQTKTVLALNNVENTALSTWAGSANITTLGAIGTGSWNATNIGLDKGGTGASLADPNADRVLFWDDSAGQVTWLTMGTNLTITGTTLDAAGGGGSPGGADTQLQYNNGGAFGGMSLSNWDDVNNDLTFGSYSGTGEFITILSSNAAATALKIDSATGTGAYVLTGASGTSFKSETSGGKSFTGLSNDAGTTNAVELLSLTHNSTGTPGTGFGTRIGFYGESTTTADTPQAYIDSAWVDATHSSRRGEISLYLARAGAPARIFRFYQNTATQICNVLDVAGGDGGGAFAMNPLNFMLDVPNGAASGGNSRGTGAVDLQTSRDNAADVATGLYSFVAGFSNRGTQDYTATTGRHAHSDRFGCRSHAAGAFSSSTPGGAQEFMCVWRRQTTDGTANVELFLDGSAARNTLVNNSTCTFQIHVLARRTNGDGENAHYKFEGAIKRDANAASTAIVGAVTKTVVAEDTAAWDAQVTADTTNGSVKVDVTGEAAKNINWVATGYFVETRE